MKKIIFLALFIILLLSPKSYALNISAESACMIIADTNQVIFEKNAYEKMPMASTTKIMTAILALEKSSPDDLVTVSPNAAGVEGSSIYLERGDKIRMEDLLYGLMLNSGNDAAVAISEYISGNPQAFALEMTEFAKKIGAENSSFKNPNGLDEDGHHTTAYDLSVISSFAMKNPDFKRIVATKERSAKINNGDILYFSNHNKLLSMYDGTIGIKTGYTKKSGRCLVSAVTRDGITLIAVTLNAPDDWQDHIAMFDYGFSNCKITHILDTATPLKTIYTPDNQEISCFLDEIVSIPTFKNIIPDSEIIAHLPKSITNTIKKGEKIGEAEILVNGRVYDTVDIISDRDILKPPEGKSLLSELKKVFNSLFKIYLRT